MKRLKGMTLVEILVAMAISSALLLTVVYTVINSNKTFAGVNFSQQHTSALVDVYNRIYNNARVAVDFPTSTTIGNVTYCVGSDVNPFPNPCPAPSLTTSHTLIMRLYSIAADGRILCDINGQKTLYDVFVYTLDANHNLLEVTLPNQYSIRPQHSQIVFSNWSSLNFAQTKNSPTDHRVITFLLGQTYKGVEKKIFQAMVARND